MALWAMPSLLGFHPAEMSDLETRIDLNQDILLQMMMAVGHLDNRRVALAAGLDMLPAAGLDTRLVVAGLGMLLVADLDTHPLAGLDTHLVGDNLFAVVLDIRQAVAEDNRTGVAADIGQVAADPDTLAVENFDSNPDNLPEPFVVSTVAVPEPIALVLGPVHQARDRVGVQSLHK